MGKVYAYGVLVNVVPPETGFLLARQHIEKALELDNRNPAILSLAVGVYGYLGERELAMTHINRAVALNPNDPQILDTKGAILCFGGNLQEALDWFAKGEKIEPYGPDDPRLDCLCVTYYLLGQYEKVLQIHRALNNTPNNMKLCFAASLAMLGRTEESHTAAKSYLDACAPEHNAGKLFNLYMKMMPRKEDRDRWSEGHSKAGLI